MSTPTWSIFDTEATKATRFKVMWSASGPSRFNLREPWQEMIGCLTFDEKLSLKNGVGHMFFVFFLRVHVFLGRQWRCAEMFD